MDIIARFQAIVNDSHVPIIDGKIHRIGKKDEIWYVGHTWDFNGKQMQSIHLGSWNGTIQETRLKSWDYKDENHKFKKKYADMVREAQAKLKVEAHEKHKSCIDKWKPIFENAKKAGEHEYLTHKGISPFLTRIDFNGVLLIPCYNVNGFVGVQRIFKDPETGNFAKKFSYGIEIDGAICPLTPFKKAEFCFLSEGFATAASIQEAFPEIPSVCAFNAGNLSKAIATIRSINQKIKIVIAADRDYKTHVGERYAKKCSETYSDVIFKLPELDSNDWSDFNDLHQFSSIDAVKKQLAFEESDFTSIKPLGYNGGLFYYTSSTFKQVLPLSSSSHNKANFFALAEKKFWGKKYGFVTDEGQLIIPYDDIMSMLMAECRKLGIFDPQKVRGTGVWKDDEDFVINNGESIVPYKKSSYHYQICPKIDFDTTLEMSDEDAQNIVASFSNLCYKNPKDAIVLSAFVAQAQVFSALPWRFHLWLSGSKGTGKSKILEWISKMIINPSLVINTTVAGVIQGLQNDARVTVYDEAEPESDYILKIIELARQMSTLGEFKVLRGTTSGKAISTNTNTIFALGSIQLPKLNGADRSRFFVVEMDSIKDQDQSVYDTLCENFTSIAKNKNLLFARCFNNLNVIIKNFEMISKYLKTINQEPRMADQIGMALSCYAIMHHTNLLNEEEIKSLVEYAQIDKSAYKEQNESNDNIDCYGAMLDVVVDSDKNTVGGIIEKIRNMASEPLDMLHQYLFSYGLKFDRSKNQLFISLNASMEKSLNKYPDYMRLLRRSDRLVLKEKTERINGTVKKGIVLNVE